MKKIGKLLVATLVAVIFLVQAVPSVSASANTSYVLANEMEASERGALNGWQQRTINVWSGTRYIPNTGWYFYVNGNRIVGWLFQGGQQFYLSANASHPVLRGRMVTGPATIGGLQYYFRSNGAMATGWFQRAGWGDHWFFSNHAGVMQSGTWLQYGGQWYWFVAGSGAMARNGIHTVNGVQHRFAANGVWLGQV